MTLRVSLETVSDPLLFWNSINLFLDTCPEMLQTIVPCHWG